MPTYEYACTRCGTHVEVVQRFGDDPLTECGVCGGPLRKVFHPAGIVFKGSGFYVTDSRSSPAKKGSGGSTDGVGEKTGDKSGAAEGSGGKKKKESPDSGAAAKEKSA